MPRAVSKTPEAIFGGTTGGRRSGDTWMLRQGGGFTKPGEEGALLSACVGCGFVLGTPGRGLPSQSGFKIDEVSRWPALRLDIAGCERVAGFEIAITVHGTLETLASMAVALLGLLVALAIVACNEAAVGVGVWMQTLTMTLPEVTATSTADGWTPASAAIA